MRIDVKLVFGAIALVLAVTATAAAQSAPAESGAVTPTPPVQQPAAQTPPAAQTAPSAEADADQTVQELRTVMQSNRRDLVNQLLNLTPEEHEKFWPVYSQYRADMTRVNNRMFVLIRDFADNFNSLTDEKAQGLLQEHLSIEDDAHRVKTAYVERFARVLPAKKVARFYQIDNKIDTLLRAELAQDIPLVR
jgi:hypothetical protein